LRPACSQRICGLIVADTLIEVSLPIPIKEFPMLVAVVQIPRSGPKPDKVAAVARAQDSAKI
jgi:hypothetical protein